MSEDARNACAARGFTLDHVVPWGRSFDEYRQMFPLTADDLREAILGCADGPASRSWRRMADPLP